MNHEDQAIPESLLNLISHSGRVVPLPKPWNRLWMILLGKNQQPNGNWEPPLPLVLDAWWHSNDSQKRERFLEHLVWAQNHGQTAEITELLSELKDEDWYCGGG